jgi:murein DD-endopeptidase MepM/ murein hydrolase activator NlpD
LTDFGWTRLAYLLAVLSVLSALAQLGSPSAEPRSLASDPPDRRPADTDPTTANEPYRRESTSPLTSVAPREKPSAPAVARHLKWAGTGGTSVAPGADRAVFYHPAPVRVEPEPDGGPGPVCGNLARFPNGNRLVFPLPMQHANSYEDTWGAPRPQGGHEGTDLMVPTGTPEYAVTDGTVVPVIGSNSNGWNSLGGYAVMLRAAYSVGPVREGDLFYYAHLQRESSLPLGAKVRAGQLLGYAGDTGQGPEVTRGLFPPHLHFGWYNASGTRSYLPSGAMNPFPLLEWIGAGGGVLGGGMDARYCEVPRSGAPTPSTGEDRWPAAREAGARPDLDTGTRRPAPSPAAGKARSPVRPTGQAGDPTHGAPRAAGAHNAPAKTAPDREPEPPRPKAPSAEPSTRDAAPETDPGRPPAVAQDPKDSPNAPVSSSENVPAEEQGHEAEGSEDAQRDPNEGTEVQDAAGTGREEPEEEEPEEEEPGGDTGQPDEESASDEDETASEPGGDPDEAEANGPEDPEDEPPQETTDATTEATTLE